MSDVKWTWASGMDHRDACTRIDQIVAKMGREVEAFTPDDPASIILEAAFEYTARLIAVSMKPDTPDSVFESMVEHFESHLDEARRGVAVYRSRKQERSA
jgi:hypothetical protein